MLPPYCCQRTCWSHTLPNRATHCSGTWARRKTSELTRPWAYELDACGRTLQAAPHDGARPKLEQALRACNGFAAASVPDHPQGPAGAPQALGGSSQLIPRQVWGPLARLHSSTARCRSWTGGRCRKVRIKVKFSSTPLLRNRSCIHSVPQVARRGHLVAQTRSTRGGSHAFFFEPSRGSRVAIGHLSTPTLQTVADFGLSVLIQEPMGFSFHNGPGSLL